MGSYPALAASRYIVDDYARVSDHWRRYEAFGRDEDLRAAAELMCQTFGRLAGDGEFWVATSEAVRDRDREDKAVRKVLADLTLFREFEERALMDLGVRADQASRLGSEVILAIRMTEDLPRADAVENLRGAVGDLGARICEVAAPAPAPAQGRSWRKRLVFKGVRVLGGAAIVAADGLTAAPFLAIPLLSIGGGLAVMATDAFGD
jgi:hypothetical protein